MPSIEVTDEAYEQLSRYARRWNQTEGQAVATLVRLYIQPEHTVEAPPATPVFDDSGLALIHFSATDSRKDPSSVPANQPLWSNTVPITL